MSATSIGKVRAGKSGKSFEVKWSASSKEVYVVYGVATQIGKASSASEAMTKAEAWLYDK